MSNDPTIFEQAGLPTVRLGCLVPDVFPLSFQQWPDTALRPLEEIAEIVKDPRRRPARQRWSQIWNQGRRGSCNAYAAAAALARVCHQQTGKWVELAPEFTYMNINGGQDRGSLLPDGMRSIATLGIPPKGAVPYESYRVRDVDPMAYAKAKEAAQDYRAFEVYQMPTTSLEALYHAVLSCLAGRGAVVVAVHVGTNYMRSKDLAGVDRGVGNHAVAVDDIILRTPQPRAITDFLLNSPQSWGTNFGANGWLSLSAQSLAGTYRTHAIYGIRSATATRADQSATIIPQ
jgi:hypothetical protein